MNKKNEMVLYFIDIPPDGNISLHSCYHSDRHKIWKLYPHSKEIDKKNFYKMVAIIKKYTLTNQ